MARNPFDLTPRQIVRRLDEYIVGQRAAKRAVAIALRNRWRRRRVEGEIRDEIAPANILMIGPTGVGKTEIARRLARLAGAPFVKVEASKFTEVGYVGRDVESIVRDLVEVAVAEVREEQTREVEAAAETRVEERLLDLLLPPPSDQTGPARRRGSALDDILQAVGGGQEESEGSGEEAPARSEAARRQARDRELRHQRTREKIRKRLEAGELEDAEVEIKVKDSGGSMMQVFGPMGMEEMGINLQEMLGPMLPGRKKSRRVPVSEARSLLLGEEIEKLLDMDAVVSEALRRAEENGIVFLDEIDKICGEEGEGGSGPDVSREGVQRDILPIIEGTRVVTKYGAVNTDHILFIGAGAFHTARPSDLIPELQGRLPIRVELDSLSRADFARILTRPKNALVKQFTALLASEGVELRFEDKAVKGIAELAETLNETAENIGARRLQMVMTHLLEKHLFELPSKKVTEVVVTPEMVQEAGGELLEDEDVGRYIL